MFHNTDKRQLYWLIDLYLSNKMDSWSFTKEVHNCYDLEIDLNTLTPLENEMFSELSLVSSRFSPYKEDHLNCPGTYFTQEQLQRLAVEIKQKLKAEFDKVEEEIKDREIQTRIQNDINLLRLKLEHTL